MKTQQQQQKAKDSSKIFTVCEAEHTQNYLQVNHWDFPGGPAVKTLPSNAGDAGSTPGRGVEIHMPHGQKAKT